MPRARQDRETALHLSGSEVAELAAPAEHVEVVRDAYRQIGTNGATRPRTTVKTDDTLRLLTNYMVILPDTGVMGSSAGAFADRKPGQGVKILHDYHTANLLGVVGSSGWNPFKTGATGAVGVEELAREDSTVVGVIGSGPQAKGQLRSIATVRDVERVKVYSPTPDHREAFVEEASGAPELADLDLAAVPTSEEAVVGSDVVVTATMATEPVFDGRHLEAGTHVNTIGQFNHRDFEGEIDETTITRAKYVPDLRERVLDGHGAFPNALERGVVSADHIHAELGEVVAGAAPGRESDDEITVFDSGGTAIETIASAYMLYEKAREADLGRPLDMGDTEGYYI